MPNTSAAKKALRTSRRKREVNLAKKEKITNSQRNLRKALHSGSKDIKDHLSKAFSALDKAVKSNYIPKKRADRKKSRLAKMVEKA